MASTALDGAVTSTPRDTKITFAMTDAKRFDAGYYRRFYEKAGTCVADSSSVERLAGFVTGYLRYLQLPVRSVLDLGCGLGHWRTALKALVPRASYRGVEWSEYQCDRMGWEHGSVVDYAPGRAFVLVVCQGVLQYLDDASAARAIQNLGRLSQGALYLEALTRRDWRHNVDRALTDGDVHLRTGDWYMHRLKRKFMPLGGGLFVRRSAGVSLFELETLT